MSSASSHTHHQNIGLQWRGWQVLCSWLSHILNAVLWVIIISTFKCPGWCWNFSAGFKKALWLFEQKSTKLLNKWNFVELELIHVYCTVAHTNPHQLLFFGFSSLHRTHNKSPPAVHIGYGQTVAGDPHRTAASRHTWAAHPRIARITDPPPSLCPLKIAYNKHHRFWDLTIVTYPYHSCKALPPYFRMKTWWWPH